VKNKNVPFEAHNSEAEAASAERDKKDMPLTRYAIDQIAWRYELKERYEPELLGIPTGFRDIDRLTFGLRPGIAVAASRPEVSLSDFALNIALNASKKHKVAYFCPGFDKLTIARRALSILSMIGFSELDSGKGLNEKAAVNLREELKLVRENLTFFADNLDGQGFYDKCTKILENNHLDLVILDKLQSLYQFESPGQESFYWKAREIAAHIHSLKSEHGLALLVLSEIKKRKKWEADLTPDDLRDFGTFEYDAYPIFLLEEDESDNRTRAERGECANVIVHIENNRIGTRRADVNLTYFGSGKYIDRINEY